jgi:hypothetical protein
LETEKKKDLQKVKPVHEKKKVIVPPRYKDIPQAPIKPHFNQEINLNRNNSKLHLKLDLSSSDHPTTKKNAVK